MAARARRCSRGAGSRTDHALGLSSLLVERDRGGGVGGGDLLELLAEAHVDLDTRRRGARGRQLEGRGRDDRAKKGNNTHHRRAEVWVRRRANTIWRRAD
eukprot:7368119-Prymnesium_polylepis.1